MRIVSIVVLLLIAGNLSSTDSQSAANASISFNKNESTDCFSEDEREIVQKHTQSDMQMNHVFTVYCSKAETVTNCRQRYTESVKVFGQSHLSTIWFRDVLSISTLSARFACTNEGLVQEAMNSTGRDCFLSNLHIVKDCIASLASNFWIPPTTRDTESVIECGSRMLIHTLVASMFLGNESRWQHFKECSVGAFRKCKSQIFSTLMYELLNFVQNEPQEFSRNEQQEKFGYAPSISIKATTLHSITIGWVIPQTEPQLHVIEYLVDLVDVFHTRRLYGTLITTSNTHVFENLYPNTTYRIKVTACRNGIVDQWKCLGSYVTARTLDRDPKFIPTLFILAPIVGNSFRIGWLPPPPELRDRVYQYKVIVIAGGRIRKPEYLPKTATFYEFYDLQLEGKYGFRVAACGEYATQCSNWSSMLEHFIIPMYSYLKYVPNVSVTATTSDSITIGWSQPPPEFRNQIYKYKVMASLWDKILGPVYVAETANSYVFQNLEFETEYQFRVAACFENIFMPCGYWSPEQKGLTIDRDPIFIPNVLVKATTSDSIWIEWSAPPLKLREHVHQFKLKVTHQDEVREPVFLNGTVNTYIFRNLSSLTDYQFKVAACSEYATQCANWSSEETGRTVDRDPKFVPTVWTEATTLNSITIGWSTPPAKLRDLVSQYKVMAIDRKGTVGSVYVNKVVHSYTFENLTSETSYHLKVAACSIYTTQCGNWSSELGALTITKVEVAQDVMRPILTVAVALLAVGIIWIVIQKRRETAARKRFMEETLNRFNVGAVNCLDMELNVGDQAELLPYDQKWEYPRELLEFDSKVLGSGAFGIVKKAKAKSICRTEAVSTVAVKMVRSTSTLNYMTVLSRELKILAYLGKHVNVVNLLGACTKNVGYGELFVIVEFCCYGNLRDYLVRHRGDFVNETDLTTDIVNAGANCGMDHVDVNNSGTETSVGEGDFTTADHGNITDTTNSDVAIDVCAPGTEAIRFDLRSKYEGDYADLSDEPIRTENLMHWAWQVARGMKFLGSRRILHGDLAARNILLSDHNIVKICDFGLAQTLYTDENYEKKDQDPLPVKWMAMESLKDRIFSVKSDVWSYGIVLWEFFSLGETPYPEIRPRNVHQKLVEGYRMVKPKHATPDIYDIMLKCWDASPSKRPSFETLISSVYVLLDGSFTTQYLDLSATYIQLDDDPSSSGGTDYLLMGPSLDTSDTVEQTMESSV